MFNVLVIHFVVKMSNKRKKSTKSSTSSQNPYNNDDVEDDIMEELWDLNNSQATQSSNSTQDHTDLPPGDRTAPNSTGNSASNLEVTHDENQHPSPNRSESASLSSQTNQTPFFSQRRVVLRPVTNISNILRQHQPLRCIENQTPTASATRSSLNVTSVASSAEISNLQNLCKDILKYVQLASLQNFI